MSKFIFICLLISISYCSSNIIKEVKTIDRDGNIYVITTVCNNGVSYSTVSQANRTKFSLAQDFEYDVETKIIREISCEQNFNKIKEK